MTTNNSPNPDALFAAVMHSLGISKDAALARALEVAPSIISKIRHRRSSVTADLLLRMHEETAMPLKTLKAILASGASSNVAKDVVIDRIPAMAPMAGQVQAERR
jgi:transcriptional regulator with XRE-family HTH domain